MRAAEQVKEDRPCASFGSRLSPRCTALPDSLPRRPLPTRLRWRCAGAATVNCRRRRFGRGRKLDGDAPAPQPASPYVIGQPPQQVSATHHPIKYLEDSIRRSLARGTRRLLPRGRRCRRQPRKPDPISLSNRAVRHRRSCSFSRLKCASSRNDVPQARKNFQKALTMWPGQVEVLRAAARMEDRQGNLPLAENLYQQAVTANPQHAGCAE